MSCLLFAEWRTEPEESEETVRLSAEEDDAAVLITTAGKVVVMSVERFSNARFALTKVSLGR